MRRRRLARAAGLVFVTFVLALLASNAQAKVWTVNIQGNAFVPQSVSIAEGDSIRWVNLDSVSHTSTSDTGVWTSGSLAHNASYERGFPSQGSFAYHCEFHPSMHGTVTVSPVATSRETWGRVKKLYQDR